MLGSDWIGLSRIAKMQSYDERRLHRRGKSFMRMTEVVRPFQVAHTQVNAQALSCLFNSASHAKITTMLSMDCVS